MTYTTLKLDAEGPLATITLNRPDKRNAITPQMIQELMTALEAIEKGSSRVAILTGAGKAFCAGMDLEALKQFPFQSPEDVLQDARRIAAMFRKVYLFPKPLIAAVNGAAVAGGCGLATFADFTLAVPEGKFGYTEVHIGFMPAIVAAFVVRQVGEKRARDLLLTGRIFTADEALRIGLVNEIVPADQIMSRARELANSLLELSPTSLAFTKGLLRKFTEADLDRDLALAVEESTRIRATADFREGL
ncbi:MAG TPA: enoyl-CoA hydratase-related protein, partial [Terriglobia bacterium]|nr:enoyl-CoA hydratase-related protein [Terriglobia bacterium]